MVIKFTDNPSKLREVKPFSFHFLMLKVKILMVNLDSP